MPKLSHKNRRRLSIFLVLVWLPVYIYVVSILLAAMPRMHILVELVIYIFVAFAWALPFRFVFSGVGRADPKAPEKKFLDDDFLAEEKANRNRNKF